MRKIIYITLTIFLFSCLTPKEDVLETKDDIETPKVEIIQEPEPEKVVIDDSETYIASDEEYDKTFVEIEVFISDLNKIISSADFLSWQNLLSQSYKDKYGDSTYLQKLSDNPVLKDYGIKLKKLRDYFNFVVVPSRSNVVIDEIQFITEDTLKAFTIINNEKIVVYLLVRSGTSWIITD